MTTMNQLGCKFTKDGGQLMVQCISGRCHHVLLLFQQPQSAWQVVADAFCAAIVRQDVALSLQAPQGALEDLL